MILEQFNNPSRIFQYDYIYIDAIFLAIWIFILLKNKKYSALIFGAVISPIIYYIDAHIWWNGFSATGTFMREYWIGGMAVPHPLGTYFWQKFGADFMMTISYALFTFPWLWIMFEGLRSKAWKQMAKYTLIFFGFWILIPLLSILLPTNNVMVETVRHTSSNIWLINLLIGYGLLFLVYRRELATVGKVSLIGMLGALIMEVPLFVFSIRPTGIGFILLEAVFLLNQGVPYLFLVWDKVLPKLKMRTVYDPVRGASI